MPTVPLLSLNHITIDFPGVRALDDVSFDLEAGEVHAVIGENGAGKSTFIKIIGGVWPYGTYEGQIMVEGQEARFHHVWQSEQHQIRIIHQELSLVNEMSVAENICLGNEPTHGGVINYAAMHRQAREVLEQLQCDIMPDQQVSCLTIGEQQIVEIAKALSKKARVLVLDEPTAALPERDVETLLALIEELKREGIGIIYISHRLREVRQIADRITVLRNGHKVQEFRRGEYTANDLVQSMIGRSIEKAFPSLASRHDEPLLAIQNVTLHHPDHRDRTILRDISLTCHRGEVIGIAGRLGSGRTALLSLLFGAFQGEWQGEIFLDRDAYAPASPGAALELGVALVTEDRKRYGLLPTADVAESLGIASLGEYCQYRMLRRDKLIRACQRIVERLDIKTPSLDFLGSKLSGGNQQKVIFGRLLMTQPRLLLLDDPTRGVDVGAKYEIYHLIQELARQGMGILFVSSELPEVLGVAHRTLVLHDGRICAEFQHGEADEAEVLALASGV